MNTPHNEELRKEWHQFTEDDTKNPKGLGFVILSWDEKTIADWWLSHLTTERTALIEELKVETKRLKFSDLHQQAAYNLAIEDAIRIVKSHLESDNQKTQ